MSFDIYGSQIDGARDYQEDAFLVTHLGDEDAGGSMVIVADGMGGHAAGNVASNMAVQTFNRHLSSNFPNENISNVLYEAVLQANGSITATVAETAALKGMGCTLVACVLERDELRWVSVGDSHLYLIRSGDLEKKNADHSYGGFLDRMAEAGTPVEAEEGFSRNMLMSALTGDDIAEIDCPEAGLKLIAGDRVILSSDGLDTLPHEKVVEIATDNEAVKDCVDALIKAVEDAGAPRQDNTTVIVIDVTEKVEVAPEPETVPTKQEDEDDLTRPAYPPAAVKEAETPFEVVDAPRTGSPVGMIIAIVVILAVLGGGGFWFMTQGEKAPAPAPTVVEDGDLVDMEPVEDEPMVPGEVVSDAQPAPTPTPAPAPGNVGEFRDRLKSGGQGPQMVWLPAGQFMMGSNLPTSDPAERPYHKVALTQFAIGVNEVSVAEYRKFAEATTRKMPNISAASGDEEYFPMFYVSWEDALAYTKWLSQ